MRSIRALSFLNLLAALSPIWAAQLDAQTFSETEFDFLVVGGGTAGTTVAVRLSEISNFTVGIIEAGEWNPDDERINVPHATFTSGIQSNPAYSWNFQTVPQTKLNNRSLFMSRGKVLGGSSALNLMGLFLGRSIEYDEIGALGNPGWSYENTLKYFKKATSMREAPADVQTETYGIFDPSLHGTSGPLKQSFSSWWSQIIPTVYSTLASIGFEITDDENNSLETGVVWNPPLNINPDTKTRSYAANEYYLPNQERPNLHLVTNAHVTKLNFARAHRREDVTATGVDFVVNGETFTVNTRKEVIVSGGGVQSPQILELSGIGNPRILRRNGIKTIVNLPSVGENYQEHIVATQAVKLADGIDTWDLLADPARNASAWQEYQDNGTGPYTSSINAIAYATAARTVGDRQDLSGALRALDKDFYASSPSAGRRAVYEIERARYEWDNDSPFLEFYCAPILSFRDYFEPNTSYAHFATISPHHFSRGSIHIGSSDPMAPPLIDINAWDLEFDRWAAIKGAKFVHENVIQAAGLAGSITSLVHPQELSSDNEWGSFIAETVDTPYHPCCTNAMLPKEWDGVVDPSLKVYGTKNVRVIDVSILPFTLATHLAAAAYTIAEQGADIIKEAYGYPITP